jgi:hypothetical protein
VSWVLVLTAVPNEGGCCACKCTQARLHSRESADKQLTAQHLLTSSLQHVPCPKHPHIDEPGRAVLQGLKAVAESCACPKLHTGVPGNCWRAV